MPRIYVLQASELAAAAARMKADVNYIGMLDRKTAGWLAENHVFIRDGWEEGRMTERRLQRLYHQLFPGDLLIADMTLEEELLMKAFRYAHEAGTSRLLCVREGESPSSELFQMADLVVSQSERVPDTIVGVVRVQAGQNLEGIVGALALCHMNGLDAEKSGDFLRRAGEASGLPWYDEIAYQI